MREIGADVQAGFYYLAYGFFIRIGYMVLGLNELDRFAVTYYVSFETILLAQQLCQEIIAGCYRHTVPVVITAHYTFRMRFLDDSFERIEMDLMQFAGSHMRVGTDGGIAATLRNAVNGKMFQRGSYTVLLDTFYHLCAQFAYQIRVFPVGLQHTSPARIAGYVEDGSVHIIVS